MRIYTDPKQAFREVERDLWEMGIDVHPQTMQNKLVADNPDYMTKELQSYGFKIHGWRWNAPGEMAAVDTVVRNPQVFEAMINYLELEYHDRIGGRPLNPGNSYAAREGLWKDFLVDGRFHYTYSERIAPQIMRILEELNSHPDTRQAIINIHSNICAQTWGQNPDRTNVVSDSADLNNIGGSGRIPCSMYYQIMRRNDKVDLIYTMRSCDFLTHFPVDVMLALRLQSWFAFALDLPVGNFTYFTGSLHAYHKDMRDRGIF